MTRPHVILMLSLATVWMATAFPLAAMTPPPHLGTALEAQWELVRKDPGNPVAQNDLGNLLTLAGHFAEAEDAYRKAIELSPAETAPRFNLALLYQQTGNAQKAQAELEALLKIAPDHAWAYYQLGVLAAAKRSRDKAINYYARALALDPGLSFASNNPHILDNPLFGEALLRSQRYRDKPATHVPRQYGEAQRIIDLMLPQETMTETAAEAGEEEAAPDDEAQESGDSMEGRSGRPVASAQELDEASPDGELTPTRSLSAPTRSSATPSSRSTSVGTPTAGVPTAGRSSAGSPSAGTPAERGLRETPPPVTVIQPSQPGRAAADQPGRVGRSSAAGEPTSGSRLRPVPQSSQGETVPPSSEGLKPEPSNPPRSRYIPPSRRSTAQLDLKLLPEETAG